MYNRANTDVKPFLFQHSLSASTSPATIEASLKPLEQHHIAHAQRGRHGVIAKVPPLGRCSSVLVGRSVGRTSSCTPRQPRGTAFLDIRWYTIVEGMFRRRLVPCVEPAEGANATRVRPMAVPSLHTLPPAVQPERNSKRPQVACVIILGLLLEKVLQSPTSRSNQKWQQKSWK